MIYQKYQGFRRFTDPDPFLEKNLIVSDGMGFHGDPGFRIDRYFFHNNVLIHIISGKFHVEQYGRHIEVFPGETVLLKLTDPHIYYSDKSGCEFVWFHFRGATCMPLLQTLQSAGMLPYKANCPEQEKRICECFDMAAKNTDDYEIPLSGMLYSILLETVGPVLTLLNSREMPGEERFMRRIKRYVEGNLDRKISLEELAEHMGMSKFYFSRKFREYFGVSPGTYIAESRVNLAKKYLVSTNDTLARIAELLGYADQSHFSKQFRQYTGMNPSEYRHVETLRAAPFR